MPRNDAADGEASRDALQDRKKNILIVDDDDDVREVVAEMLTDLGYRVTEAASAKSAYDLAHAVDDLGLVVTDVVMPEESGPELAARLRRDFPDLRIVFISGYRHLHGLDEERVLAKPFTSDALAVFVAEGLGLAD